MNIIITGASKGLGKAFANVFAPNNTLLLCARNIEELTKTANELQSLYSNTTIHTKQADLSQKHQCIEFANWCNSFGVCDVLINNAGSFIPGSIYNEEDGVIERMINTNLYSAYYVTKNVLSNMLSHKNGHIFNVCSIASVQAYSNGGSYSISKFALLGFSKNLREELKPHNIKVTSILPGAVFTDSWKGSGVDEKRIMEDKDIAKLVFAASQLSPQACVEEILIRPQLGDL